MNIKTFSGLYPHTQVRITFTFYSIDSWDNEIFTLEVDNSEVYTKQYKWGSGTSICGDDGYEDRVTPVSIAIDHTSSSILIYLTTNLDSGAGDGNIIMILF